jgi:hypothetical protein
LVRIIDVVGQRGDDRMDFIAFIKIAEAIATASEGLTRMLSLAIEKGELTDEQINAIRAKARASDSEWDARVAASRQRVQEKA